MANPAASTTASDPAAPPVAPPAPLPWERQPGEAAAHYKLFQAYLSLGWGRGLKETADATRKTYEHVRRVARDNLWEERSNAYDDHLLERFGDRFIEASLKSFERDQQALLVLRSKVLEGFRNLDMTQPKAGEVARLADVMFRHSRLLFGNPLQILAGAAAPDGEEAPASADMLAFSQMGKDERDRVLDQMREALSGRAHARSGVDDA